MNTLDDKREFDLCNFASQMAGPVDRTWNERFITTLAVLGRKVVVWRSDWAVKGPWLWPPKPMEAEFMYPYPGLIVPLEWNDADVAQARCEDQFNAKTGERVGGLFGYGTINPRINPRR